MSWEEWGAYRDSHPARQLGTARYSSCLSDPPAGNQTLRGTPCVHPTQEWRGLRLAPPRVGSREKADRKRHHCGCFRQWWGGGWHQGKNNGGDIGPCGCELPLPPRRPQFAMVGKGFISEGFG